MVALDFGAVLSQWPALLRGAAFTLGLSAVAAAGGLALGVACGWARAWGPKTLVVKTPADLAGKTVGVTRGAMEDQEVGKIAPPGVDIKRFEDMELSKIAPASADVKRFEDNNATVAAFVSGQVQVLATGASVAGNMMARNPQLGTEYKFVLKDSPNFIGVNKGEDKLRLKVNEIIAAAKASGELNALAMKWLGRPLGDLPS